MTQASWLVPAFADPVHDTQQVFRRALTALSEPGLIQQLDDQMPALDPLTQATYALCLCLFDSDTPVWISPLLDTPAVRANLAFHCGCPVVENPALAAFAVMDVREVADFPELNPGTDRDPDLSCTVLMQVGALSGGMATTWQGPGILDARLMHLPVPEAFWNRRASYGFPRGLDFFLTSAQSFVGLPRSTRVQHSLQEVH